MNTLQLCITYYTVAVFVDRYLQVSMGLDASHYCTVRNSLRIILFITIFSIIFMLPYLFKSHIVTQIYTENGTQHEVFGM